MQNTTENTTVETKAEAKVETKPAEDVSAVSSMAEQLEAVAPEKRRVFRKACNHTARSVLLQMLIMNGLVAIIIAVYMVIAMLTNSDIMTAITSGATDNLEKALMDMLSGPNYLIWTFAATAVGGTVANIVAGLLHSKKRGYKYFESFKEGRMNFALFGGGAVVGIGAMYLWAYAYQLIQHLTGYTDPLNEASMVQAETLLSFANPVGLVIYCLYVCILAPITEEYLFRGVLLKTLSKYNVAFAAFATSLMFGLLHGNLNQTPGTFLFGLTMAYVAIRSGSIRTPIILHFLLNTYSTVMSILLVNKVVSEETLGIISLILNVLFIVGAIVIIIVGLSKKKFKWEATEPTTNHTLLPKAESRAKLHLLHFFSCFWVIVLIYISVELILTNGGFAPLFKLVADAISNAIA